MPIYQSYEAFHAQSRTPHHVEDPAPWRPFCTAGDFEFAELVLDASLNKRQVEILLGLIARVAQGAAQVTLKNDAELRKTCDTAGEELTPVCVYDLSFPSVHNLTFSSSISVLQT